MRIDDVPNLKIYKLSEEQYKRKVENGEIEENAFYFTPGGDESTVEATAMILKSPNGTRFRITVDDNGNLTASKEI